MMKRKLLLPYNMASVSAMLGTTTTHCLSEHCVLVIICFLRSKCDSWTVDSGLDMLHHCEILRITYNRDSLQTRWAHYIVVCNKISHIMAFVAVLWLLTISYPTCTLHRHNEVNNVDVLISESRERNEQLWCNPRRLSLHQLVWPPCSLLVTMHYAVIKLHHSKKSTALTS